MPDQKVTDQNGPCRGNLDLASGAVFGFSWLLVTVIGLMPLYDRFEKQDPAISMPAIVVFFTALASGIALKSQYSWIGLALHIIGQILIWLSLFCISLAIALYAAG